MQTRQVVQCMKTHVVKVTQQATLRDALDRMDLYQVDGLPVVDAEEKIVGFLTEGDVVNALWSGGQCQHRHGESSIDEALNAGSDPVVETLRSNIPIAAQPVTDYMTRAVVSVLESDEMQEAATLMFRNGYKRLPVLDEQGKVVGTLNRVDVLQALMDGDM